jgi:hypothetical protein
MRQYYYRKRIRKKEHEERASNLPKAAIELHRIRNATEIMPKKNQKERARETSKQSSESNNSIAQDMTQQ